MEGIHSYEQRSSTEISDHNSADQRIRVIIVDRHDSGVEWSTSNRPIKSRASHLFANATGRARFRGLGRPTSQTSSSLSSETFDDVEFGPFPSNEWKTSKYTMFDFLPKNMFEQFRRLANFYFLTTAILQIVTPYSPIGPTTSLLPLIFVVSVTAVKQAYEDYLRHKLDKEVNNRLYYVMRDKKLTKVRSKDIRVGDFVYVKNNEEIPCDMILLATSGSGDRCYITTANLDGETSLKSRSCFNVKVRVGTIDKLDDSLLVVECEKPNATLYEFNGNLRAPKSLKAYTRLTADLSSNSSDSSSISATDSKRQVTRESDSKQQSDSQSTTRSRPISTSAAYDILQTIYRRVKRKRMSVLAIGKQIRHPPDDSDSSSRPLHSSMKSLIAIESSDSNDCHEIPLDISNLLLRASRLRNTSFIYGLAIYTGCDTKLAHNSQVKPNKFSSTESRVNLFLMIAFTLLLLATLISANYWYFWPPENGNTRNSTAAKASYGQILMSHFLLYNYLVPISLYVTLEFVKFFGTLSVVEDKSMKTIVWKSISNAPSSDSATGPPTITNPGKSITAKTKKVKVIEGAKCNSSDLNEDLGQVEVLFSDKTGTLTENKMRFLACSIRGQMYRALAGHLYLQPAELVQVPVPNVVHKIATVSSNRYTFLAPTSSISKGSSRSGGKAGESAHFDHRVSPPIERMKLIDNLQHYEKVTEFFMCLCLCSTIALNETLSLSECLPDKVASHDYQSASPDEESLISAASLFGVIMLKSTEQECYIAIERSGTLHSPPQAAAEVSTRDFKPVCETKLSNDRYIIRHFKRLVVFEFTSTRKRMSVIYKDCDNDCIILVAKGSESLLDCVRMKHLNASGEHEINVSLAHFEAFAKSGLRTMLVGRRTMGKQEYESIERDMQEARLSQHNRNQMVSAVYKRSEVNLTLIGTTAVEDSLQEGVPETISNLKEAGIKVWLLTGDKVETAISVANLCKLLDRNMTIFNLVRQQDSKSCLDLLASFRKQINDSEQDLATEAQRTPESPVSISKSKSKSSSRSSPESPKSPNYQQQHPHKRKAHSRHHHMQNHMHTGEGKMSQCDGSIRFGLIIDGRSLYYALKYAREEFSDICKYCICVLGCRLSPLQKAEIVSLVKSDKAAPITAAIGDGANDVSMIQESHVGIGISGKEGRQAVNSSDFAISRFHMLNRLFFVHGHLFYHRTANLVHYFFYKNLLFVLPQFIYSFYSPTYATSLYHPIELISYNLFFTSLPIMVYGLYEVHIPETTLQRYPPLYQFNRHNRQLGISVFTRWLLLAATQSTIAFYLLLYFWSNQLPIKEVGKMIGLTGFAVILYFVIIFLDTAKLYLMSRYHSLMFNMSTILSCTVLPVVFVCYSEINWGPLVADSSFHKQFIPFIESSVFWIATATTFLAALVPNIIWYIRERLLFSRRLNETIQRSSHS